MGLAISFGNSNTSSNAYYLALWCKQSNWLSNASSSKDFFFLDVLRRTELFSQNISHEPSIWRTPIIVSMYLRPYNLRSANLEKRLSRRFALLCRNPTGFYVSFRSDDGFRHWCYCRHPQSLPAWLGTTVCFLPTRKECWYKDRRTLSVLITVKRLPSTTTGVGVDLIKAKGGMYWLLWARSKSRQKIVSR